MFTFCSSIDIFVFGGHFNFCQSIVFFEFNKDRPFCKYIKKKEESTVQQVIISDEAECRQKQPIEISFAFASILAAPSFVILHITRPGTWGLNSKN